MSTAASGGGLAALVAVCSVEEGLVSAFIELLIISAE
jgi:hypothetical protein